MYERLQPAIDDPVDNTSRLADRLCCKHHGHGCSVSTVSILFLHRMTERTSRHGFSKKIRRRLNRACLLGSHIAALRGGTRVVHRRLVRVALDDAVTDVVVAHGLRSDVAARRPPASCRAVGVALVILIHDAEHRWIEGCDDRCSRVHVHVVRHVVRVQRVLRDAIVQTGVIHVRFHRLSMS
eukprot:305299-Pleurochrysis_carterae.AAC.2